MKSVKKEDYISRLEKTIVSVEKTRDNTRAWDHFCIGSLGGQLTILKRELEYLKTHKIVEE